MAIGKVLSDDAGPYTVVITNLYGVAVSAPANLIVLDNLRAIYVEDLNAAIGGTLAIPVEMLAAGDEHALNFSLLFDPAVLGNPRVTNGVDSANAVLSIDTSNVPAGSIGLSLIFPTGQAVAGGLGRELARVLFDVAPEAPGGPTTFIGFGDVPFSRYIAATNGATLYPVFAAGQLTLEEVPTVATALRLAEGQVQVRINGVPGRDYIIEGVDNLGSTHWVSLTTNQTTPEGFTQFSDTHAVSSNERFYRARLLPRSTE